MSEMHETIRQEVLRRLETDEQVYADDIRGLVTTASSPQIQRDTCAAALKPLIEQRRLRSTMERVKPSQRSDARQHQGPPVYRGQWYRVKVYLRGPRWEARHD